MFLYCYYATLLTTTLTLIGKTVSECRWYSYPIKLQKYLILMIRRTQVPFEFNGLNILNCNLPTFGLVSFN